MLGQSIRITTPLTLEIDNMYKKYFKLCFFIAIQVCFIIGCTIGVQTHSDEFYNDVGTWDSLSLPLIKPYYVIYISKDYGWQMPLKGNLPDEQRHYRLGDLLDVQKISVVNEIILVHTPYTPVLKPNTEQKVLHWFVMIPSQGNFELGFENETEFLSYIETYGISSPEWVDPKIAYNEFYRTGCFDWIPDCN